MVMKFNESQTVNYKLTTYSVASVRLDLVAVETTGTAGTVSRFALSTQTSESICHR